jgi:hypothetical protein
MPSDARIMISATLARALMLAKAAAERPHRSAASMYPIARMAAAPPGTSRASD